MAFQPPETQIPTEILTVVVVLKDRLEHDDEPASQTAHYQLVVLDQNGQRLDWPGDQGNLVPHLTPQEIAQLEAFMTMLRTRAEAAILI